MPATIANTPQKKSRVERTTRTIKKKKETSLFAEGLKNTASPENRATAAIATNCRF